MNPERETPLAREPAAADYRALLGRFYEAARAYNSGEIDFAALRRLIAQIEDETRMLNFLRKLHGTCRSLSRRESKRAHEAPAG